MKHKASFKQQLYICTVMVIASFILIFSITSFFLNQTKENAFALSDQYPFTIIMDNEVPASNAP